MRAYIPPVCVCVVAITEIVKASRGEDEYERSKAKGAAAAAEGAAAAATGANP